MEIIVEMLKSNLKVTAKVDLPYDWLIPFLGVYRMSTKHPKETHALFAPTMFPVALFCSA